MVIRSDIVLCRNWRVVGGCMKKYLCALLCILCSFTFFACGDSSSEDLDVLTEYYWESYVDILQFTREGKILKNFQADYESVSYFKLSDGKITMYTDTGVENGLTFDYELSDDKLYIGELEYRKYKKVSDIADTGTDSDNTTEE